MTLYFAFGSNMDIAQMMARCPSTRVVGPAEFARHELLFPHYSKARQCAVAGYRPMAKKSVWGVVYETSDEDLAHLDSFEGFQPGRDAALNKYNRVDVEVLSGSGQITCMTYEARPSDDPGLTSRHYLGQLVSGARHHGLPADYIAWLERFPTRD